jgi:hypothetical protein
LSTTFVSSAEGSFDSVVGVTSEKANGNSNSYSLQLNTQAFTTTACGTASGCQGWQQFLYSPGFGGFIQYWLLNYGPLGTACPSHFRPYVAPLGTAVSCWTNSANSAPAPAVAPNSLGALRLEGAAGNFNGKDSVVVSVGDSVFSTSGDNYFSDLNLHWQSTEFNVFGDGNSDEAVFNDGTTIIVRTAVSGTLGNPGFGTEGFTGETNNLTLVGDPTTNAGTDTTRPSITFTEKSASLPCGGMEQTCCTDKECSPPFTCLSGNRCDCPAGTHVALECWKQGDPPPVPKPPCHQACVANVPPKPPCGAQGQSCCNDTAACYAGLSCQDNSCQPICGARGAACCDGNKCDVNLTCQGGSCVPASECNPPCSEGETCNSQTHKCGSACPPPLFWCNATQSCTRFHSVECP